MPDDIDLTPELDDEAPEDGATDDNEAAGDENDPAAELAARFDKMEASIAALQGLDPNAVRSAIGRISSIQSSLDELSKRDPAADFDPRINASESAVVALAEALLADPTVSDSTRTTLNSAIRGIETARTAREAATREAALIAKVRAEVAPQRQATDNADDPWQRATATVLARATRLNIDPTTIPWSKIQAESDGTPEDAAANAIEWLLENKPDAPTAQVSARKAAAGKGSPAREAGAGSIETIRARAMTEGIPLTDEAARKALAADLGISL